jgi:demethylmenaquinone methyltransferase/2-methoxy-6-polyprenyl-1,4-benzoquinol methylase
MNKNETKISSMFDDVAGRYDFVNRVLSLGCDIFWRRRLVKMVTKFSDKVRLLDVATGSGDIIFTFTKAGRIDSAVGLDISKKMLNVALKKIQRRKIKVPVKFVQGSALEIPFEKNEFDVVTIGFGIRNVENLDKAINEMNRVLKVGGKLGILEFSLPENKLLRFFVKIYLRTLVPLVGGVLTGDFHSYVYLQKSIENFVWGEKMINKIKSLGFKDVVTKNMMLGAVTIYIATK